MTVSVVLPVHNTADYLTRCLRSIEAQSLDDLQIICVDDSSTDSSSRILYEMASDDSRIEIIQFSENRGVSAARNAGLKSAKGEFVYFMDSDDWIDQDYLEKMFCSIHSAGAAICVNPNYIEEYIDNLSKNRQGDVYGVDISEPVYIPSTLVHNCIFPVVWNRLFRRDYLICNGLFFPEYLTASEDYYFTGLAGMLSSNTFVFPGPYYHYTRRQDSLSSTNHFSNMVASKLLFDELKVRGISSEGLKLFYSGNLVIDSEEKFSFIRDFFVEIAPLVRQNPSLYSVFDLYCIKTVISCSDWKSFRSRYKPYMSVNMVLDKLGRKR